MTESISPQSSGSPVAGQSGLVRYEPSRRRVRVVFAGEVLADSQDAIFLWEGRRPPLYYFPQRDVRMEFLVKSGLASSRSMIGTAEFWHVQVGDRRAENAAWVFPEPRAGAPDMRGYISFQWQLMDAWFEEDEEVYVHPRDPYVRVEALYSSRHLKVVVEGEMVAETVRPVLLLETGLITRYYIPKVDIRLDLLEPSATHTACPYKGEASYYSVRAGGRLLEDLVWYYPHPLPEVDKIRNLLSFYNEKVDIYLDGVLQQRPTTPLR